jgi:UrcA family protein
MTRFTSTRATQRVFEKSMSTLGALALTALAFVASNAHAASRSEGIVLRYAHTTLASPQEAARLYSSIKSAARQVCGLKSGRLILTEYRRAQSCYRTTVEDVVSEINQPQLTAVHQSDDGNLG